MIATNTVINYKLTSHVIKKGCVRGRRSVVGQGRRRVEDINEAERTGDNLGHNLLLTANPYGMGF